MGDQILDLTNKVQDVAAKLDKIPSIEDVQKAQADAKAAAARVEALNGDLGVVQNDIAAMRQMLEAGLGKSGAQDLEHEMDMFVKAAWHANRGRKMPQWLEQKAAQFISTDVDAQGGYLVPRSVSDQIIELVLRHGQIWPLVTKFTLPAGNTIRVPNEVTLANTVWSRRSQGAALTESDAGTEWGGDTLNPQYCHGFVKLANEVFTAFGISIPNAMTMQLLKQVVRRLENGIIAGYVGSPTQYTGRTAPHNGILRATNVYEQSAAATVTYALVSKFIGESIVDHEGCGDTDEYVIITTDAVAQTLKGTLTQQGMNWGDVSQGPFPRLQGYRFVTTPFAVKANPTAVRNHIILSPIEKVMVAWDGAFRVDFNDRGDGWNDNETWLKVGTYADFTIGNPYMHSYARFTALA